MRCPHDNTVLVRHQHGAMTCHSCQRCGGLWLAAADFSRGTAGGGHGGAAEVTQTALRCPTCPATLLTRMRLHGTEIDVCHGCHGVWLDRGELEAIRRWYLGQLSQRTTAARKPANGGSLVVDMLDLLAAPELVIELAQLLGEAAKQAPDVAAEAAAGLVEFVGEIF